MTPAPELSALATQYGLIASAAVTQCNKDRVGANSSLAKAKAAARTCLDSYIHYVASFKAVNWGPAQPQADDVIAAIDTVDGLLETMANAPGVVVFEAAYKQIPQAIADLQVANNALRVALGLPPAKP